MFTRNACFLAILLAGCAVYRAQPLTPEAVNQALAVPDRDILRVKAASLQHPLLPAVTLDSAQGLTPDRAAVLAVLINPSLRALRDGRSVAAAQLIQAGLLPNPQISYNRDFVTGGNTEGTFPGYGLGMSWDVMSLLNRNARTAAARSEASSVDLDIAWQEWQFADAAKLATYKLIVLQAQREVTVRLQQRVAADLRLIRDAAQNKTLADLAAAEATDREAKLALLTVDQQLEHQRLVLRRVLGLSQYVGITLSRDCHLPESYSAPSLDSIMEKLESRRLDLVALRHGYESQEHTLHAAVLAQFPKVQLGFNKASDTSKVRTLGLGVSIDLPVFDRNQGAIAQEKATRQRLFDEYASRVFEARSDVEMALADMKALNDQLTLTRNGMTELQRLVDVYRKACDAGTIDGLTYSAAMNDLDRAQIALLQLQQQLMENKVALELAAGLYLPE